MVTAVLCSGVKTAKQWFELCCSRFIHVQTSHPEGGT